MSTDPYKVLGVAKDASQEAIQKAYRALAKKLHPDLNPGNKQAEEKFKEVSAAYDLVGDPEKRGRFDRGEIDASGAERPPRDFYRDRAGGEADRYASAEGYADFAGSDEIFADLFGHSGGGTNLRMRGRNVHYGLELDFLDAVNGAKRQVTLPDGSVLDVSIPAGTRDGQILRLRGKGMAGHNGGSPGDALVEIAVRPHRIFTRKGDDIHVELPITLREAVLGGKINVPTPAGVVAMTVPKWSNTGSVLRLKGRGAPRGDGSRGDQYVTLKVMLPAKPEPELEALIAKWHPAASDNPRQNMEA